MRISSSNIAKRVVINAFIVFHVSAIVLYGFPADSVFSKGLIELIRPYMSRIHLGNNWTMFAPDPPKVNNKFSAIVRFNNGSEIEWDFPRPEIMPFPERYARARFRIWAGHFTGAPDGRPYWADTAKFIARVYATDVANPPVLITLKSNLAAIPPPTSDGGLSNRGPANYESRYSRVLFTYRVTLEDLN